MLVWSTGSGKTNALLALVQKNARNVLIIVPKGLREQWSVKVREFGVGVPARIVTKEEFRRDAATMGGYDAVVIDELHHFSGYKSQMHKALVKYLKRTQPRFVWSGTATPYRREPFNIYALALIHGVVLDWIRFRGEYYQPRYLGVRMIWEPRTDEETRKRLWELLAQFSDFVKLEDCFDMPEQLDEEPEMLELSAEQKKAIKELRLVETNPLVLCGKIQQIESGFMYGDEFTPTRHFETAKKARIIELAEENPKLLVFCRFTEQIHAIARDLKTEGYNVLTITGENSAEHFTVSQKAEDTSACVLIAQESCATGWETPSFPVVVYASMNYGLLDMIQSRGRVIRANKLSRHVFVYLLGGAVDKAVVECLGRKADFDPATFEA